MAPNYRAELSSVQARERIRAEVPLPSLPCAFLSSPPSSSPPSRTSPSLVSTPATPERRPQDRRRTQSVSARFRRLRHTHLGVPWQRNLDLGITWRPHAFRKAFPGLLPSFPRRHHHQREPIGVAELTFGSPPAPSRRNPRRPTTLFFPRSLPRLRSRDHRPSCRPRPRFPSSSFRLRPSRPSCPVRSTPTRTGSGSPRVRPLRRGPTARRPARPPQVLLLEPPRRRLRQVVLPLLEGLEVASRPGRTSRSPRP